MALPVHPRSRAGLRSLEALLRMDLDPTHRRVSPSIWVFFQKGCFVVFRGPKFGVVNLGFRYALREENGATSAVHPESPPYLIVQTKDVLKSQDADLSKSLSDYTTKPWNI